MKEYIKKFDTLNSAHDYNIQDVPFITTIVNNLSNQNLVCTTQNSLLINRDNSILLIKPVTITGTWDPTLTDKNKKVTISGEVTLNGKTDCYSLTFATGRHLTINGGARLRVWEGGITNNDCSSVNYLTLQEDNLYNSWGEFLIHPNVITNIHPLATIKVRFPYGYQMVDSSKTYIYLRLGFIFTTFNMEGVYPNSKNYQTAIAKLPSRTGGWSWMSSGETINPFNIYNMITNGTEDTIYSITGNLVGNENQSVSLFYQTNNSVLTNSYSGKLNVYEIAKEIQDEYTPSPYIIKYDSNYARIDDEMSDSNNCANPTQGFWILNPANANVDYTINYKDLVWDFSFEEEITPSRGIMKGTREIEKSDAHDDPVFKDPEPVFNNEK